MKRILTLLLTMMMLAILSTSYAVAEETPDITVTLDGNKIDFPDAKPYLYKDRTLVPRLWALMYLGTAENRK